MSNIVLKGSTSGDVTITVPAQAGTNTVTIPAASGNLPLSNLDHVTNRPNAKPIIINGDMAVAQRGTSVTGITAAGYHTIDRIRTEINDNGTWTQTQSTDVPAGQGFATSLKFDCTTADTSVAAGSYHLARYRFEGQDLQLLKKGTSSAEKVTIAFWINATVTGTYILELEDNDNSRQISQAYTVSSANTWEKKVLSFAADTTGALGNDNALSFTISCWLGAGSNFSSGTLSTTWTSSTNANRAVGQVNGASSTSNNIYITGMQMEVGEYTADTIPPFQHESFGDSLTRCERYYKQFGGNSSHERICLVFMASATQARGQIPISMRAAPSVEGNNLQVEGTAAVTVTGIAVDQPSSRIGAINFTVNSGITAGQAAQAQGANNTSARLKLSAEL